MPLPQLRLLPRAQLGFRTLNTDLLSMAVNWCRCGEEDCDMIAELIGEFIAAAPDGQMTHHYIVRCALGHVGTPQAKLVSLDV